MEITGVKSPGNERPESRKIELHIPATEDVEFQGKYAAG
jgi:hypothetical protein